MSIKLSSSPRTKLAAQNIACVIGADPDLTVRFVGPKTTPHIDMSRKIIYIPDGDFSNDKYWKLCSGWISHEGGHNRFTELETCTSFENEFISKLPGFDYILPDGVPVFSSKSDEKNAIIKLKRLHRAINLFEDIQMEEKTGILFPKSASTLSEMYSLMVEDGFMTCDGTNIVSYIEMYILNKLRVNQLGQEGIPEILNEFFGLADSVLLGMKDRFDSLLLKATGVNSTLMACELGLILNEELEKLRDDLKEKEEKLNTPENSGDGNSDDSDDSSSRDNSDLTTTCKPVQLRKAIEDLDNYLDSENDNEQLHDFHEVLKEAITQMAASFSDEDVKNFGLRFGFTRLTEEDYIKAQNNSRDLRKLLSSLLKQNVRRNNRLSDRGYRLHGRKLVEVPMGATSVFKKGGDGWKRSDVGIVNLRDISASMLEVSVLALSANLAFTLACESVNNIDVADVVYPVQKDSVIDILKPFNKSVANCFSDYENVCSGLFTPTALAINECVEYLLRFNFSRKIIFIATDGLPSDPLETVCEAVKNASKYGIEIVCVGFGIDIPQGFEGVYFRKIHDISELTSLYRDLIRSLV